MNMIIPDRLLAIRPIDPQEVNAVLEVYRQCEDFLALGPVATASLEMVLNDIELSKQAGGRFCGIYTAEGTMIGVLDYVPCNYQGQSQAADLALLMIAASYRGQGIGEAVVEALEQEIRKDARITTIWSGVQVNNPGAIKFWQRCGYRIVSGPELLPDRTTVFSLRKDIAGRA